MKPFFNHGLRAAVANTDKHGWGKDFDTNCTNFREGVRGWMGYLPYGRRAQLAGGPPALRTEMGPAKKPSAYAKATARQDENEKIKPN